MPKGVYNRNKSVSVQETIQQEPITNPIPHEVGINKVRVSQMPDHQSANAASVEVLKQTHGDDSISTTERLFGSLEQQQQENNEDPSISQEPLISVPVAQNPEQAEETRFKESNSPKPMESTPEDDFIDWDKMSGRKIRQKVDGKEVITTVEELKKYSDQDQIKKHLADAADRVGQERRKLAEERQQWNEQRNQREAPRQEFANGQPQGISQAQDPVYQRIQFLEAQIQQLAQGVQPSIYESNRQRVANELKAQGFNDFIDYIPKMEMAIMNIKDPNQTSFYDTPEGSKALYFQLKAQDMLKAPVRTQVPKNVPRGIEQVAPPAAQIDGGSQSSGQYIEQNGQNYKSAFKRAVFLGDDKEAWNEVLRQKGILPD